MNIIAITHSATLQWLYLSQAFLLNCEHLLAKSVRLPLSDMFEKVCIGSSYTFKLFLRILSGLPYYSFVVNLLKLTYLKIFLTCTLYFLKDQLLSLDL